MSSHFIVFACNFFSWKELEQYQTSNGKIVGGGGEMSNVKSFYCFCLQLFQLEGT